MPYTAEHKAISRNRILASAYELISCRGYDAVTVDEVMANCAMTRGAFYGHFSSKAELYREAIQYAFANSKLISLGNSDLTAKQTLMEVINSYLSIEHVRGFRPCPLAFLAADISLRETSTKQTFSDAFQNVNRLVHQFASSYTSISSNDTLALTAMVVGTVALARAMDNEVLIEEMLTATRTQARRVLNL